MVEAGKQCEAMATELLALAAGADSAGRILTALDRRNIEFLDVLIENEQKEVIAHTVVQRYLQVRGCLRSWLARNFFCFPTDNIHRISEHFFFSFHRNSGKET